jgi:hypothetical protein
VYSIRGRVRRDDDVQVDTPFFDIAVGPHSIQWAWTKASAPGANNGSFDLWIDGAHVSTLSNPDNGLRPAARLRAGILGAKGGSNGQAAFDFFEWRRFTFITPP